MASEATPGQRPSPSPGTTEAAPEQRPSLSPGTAAANPEQRPSSPGTGDADGAGDGGPTSALTALRELPGATWARAAAYGAVAAVVIGVPTDVIDTPIFGRPVPVRPVDQVIWAVTSLLIGLVFAIRADGTTAAGSGDGGPEQTRALWSGFASFLSVGCPVCNQAVVALVGTSGALSWWAPVQPVIGAVAVALLVVAVRKRLLTYRLSACPLPA